MGMNGRQLQKTAPMITLDAPSVNPDDQPRSPSKQSSTMSKKSIRTLKTVIKMSLKTEWSLMYISPLYV